RAHRTGELTNQDRVPRISPARADAPARTMINQRGAVMARYTSCVDLHLVLRYCDGLPDEDPDIAWGRAGRGGPCGYRFLACGRPQGGRGSVSRGRVVACGRVVPGGSRRTGRRPGRGNSGWAP